MSTIATNKNTISVFVGAPRLSYATSAPSAVSVVMKRRRAKGNALLPLSATNGRSTPPRVRKDSVKQRGLDLAAAALPDDELNFYERSMAFQKSLRATDRGTIAPQASQEAVINDATDPKAIHLNSSAIHGLPPTTNQSTASSTFDAITVSIPVSLKAIHRFHHNASLRLKVDDRVDGNYLSSSDSDEEKESNATDNAAAGSHSGGVFGNKPSCMNTSSQLPSHNISVAMQSFEEERDQEEEDSPPVIRNIFGVAGRRQSGDVMKLEEDDAAVYKQIVEHALECRPKPLKGGTQQQDFISFKQSDGHTNDDESILRLLHIEPSGEGHQRHRSYPMAYGDHNTVPSNEDAKSISSSIITLLNNQLQDGELITVLSGAAGTGKSTRMFGPCRRRDGNTEEGAAALIDQVVSSVMKEFGPASAERHRLSAVVSAVESFPIPIHGPIPAGKDSTRKCDSIRIGYSDLGVRDGGNDKPISFDNAIDRQIMNESDPGDSIQSLLLPFYTSTHVARSADNSCTTPIFEPFGSQSEFTEALYDLLSRSRMWAARSSETKVGRAQSNSDVASTVAPISDSVEALPTVAHEGHGGESLLLFDQRMRAISGTSATLLPPRNTAADEYPVIEPVAGGFQDTETVTKGHLIVTIVFRLQSSSAAPNTQRYVVWRIFDLAGPSVGRYKYTPTSSYASTTSAVLGSFVGGGAAYRWSLDQHIQKIQQHINSSNGSDGSNISPVQKSHSPSGSPCSPTVFTLGPSSPTLFNEPITDEQQPGQAKGTAVNTSNLELAAEVGPYGNQKDDYHRSERCSFGYNDSRSAASVIAIGSSSLGTFLPLLRCRVADAITIILMGRVIASSLSAIGHPLNGHNGAPLAPRRPPLATSKGKQSFVTESEGVGTRQRQVNISWLASVRRDGLFDYRTRQELLKVGGLASLIKSTALVDSGRGRELGPFSQNGLSQQITKSFKWCSPQPAFESRQQTHRNRKRTSITQQSSNTTFIVGQSNSFIRVLTSSSPSSEILVTPPLRAATQHHPSSNKSLNQQINKKLLTDHLPPSRSNSAIMSESGHAAPVANDDDKYSDEYEFESVSNHDDGKEAALNGPTSGTNFDVDTASESSQEDHAKLAMTRGEPSDRLVTTAGPIVDSEATTNVRPTKVADGDAYGLHDGEEEEVEGASTIDAPVDNNTSIEEAAQSPTSFLQESEAIMRLKSERDALTNALLAPVGSRPTAKAHEPLIDQYAIAPSYPRTHTIPADASPDRDSECGPSSIPDTNPPPTPPSTKRGGTVTQVYEQREVGPEQVVEIARSREAQQSDVSVAAEVDNLPKPSWQDGLRAAMDRVRATAAPTVVSKVSAVSARRVIPAKNAPTPSNAVINKPRSNNTERYTKDVTTQYSTTKDSFITAQPQPVERDANSSTTQSVRDEADRSSHALLSENLRLRSLLAESRAELRGTLADQSTFIQSLGTSVVEPIIEFYDNQHAAEVADHRHQQRESAEVLKSLIIQNSLGTELGQSTNNPSVPSYNNQPFVNNYFVTDDDPYHQPLHTSTVTESDRTITAAAANFSKELAMRRAVRNAVVGNKSLNTTTSVPTIDKENELLRSQLRHANQSLLSMSALRHSSLSRPRVAASTGQVPSTLYPSRPSMRSSSAAAPVVSHFYDADGNLITPTDTFRKVLNHTGSAYEKQTLRLQRLTGQFDKLKIDHAHISLDRDRMTLDLASNQATIQALRKQVAELSDRNAVLEVQLLHDGAADTVKDIFAQGANGGNLFTVSMSADQDAVVAGKGDDSSGRVVDQQDALLAAIAIFAEDVYSVTGAVEEALSRAGHSDAALIGPTVTRLTGGLRRRMQQEHLQSIIPAAREAHLALVRANARERQCLNLIVSSNLPLDASKQRSSAASQPRAQISSAGPSNSMKK